jgi:hypothetical protein
MPPNTKKTAAWIVYLVVFGCLASVLITFTVLAFYRQSKNEKINANLILYAEMVETWNDTTTTYGASRLKFISLETANVTDHDLLKLKTDAARFCELNDYLGIKSKKDGDLTTQEALNAFLNDVSKIIKDRTDFAANLLEMKTLMSTITDDWKRMDERYREQWKDYDRKH